MDTQSAVDPVEEVYDLRTRGAFFITTRSGQRVHMHSGCWIAPCSHNPPRMMVAFPKEFEGAKLVLEGEVFALNLVSRDQKSFLETFFAGRHHIDELGRELFYRAPSGCPVPRESLAYFDCKLTQSIDLGDFVLAIGDVTSAAVLNDGKANLTVNQIIAEADPRYEELPQGPAKLPFEGFNFDTDLLAPIPVEHQSTIDGDGLERVYAMRDWGLFFCSVSGERGGHFHIGCWSMQVSHAPPRLVVCFDKAWPETQRVQNGAPFALTLIAEDQAAWAAEFMRTGDLNGNDGPVSFRELGPGRLILEDGVGYFDCVPQSSHDVGDFIGVIAEVSEFGMLRPEARDLRA